MSLEQFRNPAALLAFVSAAAFSAYLRPDMFVAFADVFSFCMNLLR